ncbi:DUF1565 domain-containing protein [Massilia sp. PAMC28688]|uniref:right-handed parallel beta-helix repeat-containing protein n=1 Tax=Massilia sp. PAMC28688 TaxID=2861283 RepID=UPI001C62B593|nr:DUF1565 domain-containing protein [Massilia sp. PAMC28688]QYF95403.1 DUF1565 domain-containing protein [Massilia sp. PAMC28688]
MNQKTLSSLAPLLAFVASPAPWAAQPPDTATYNYYVAPHGSDSNPGTAQSPFQTILRASRVALPGTTVHVAPGTYVGGFKTTMSGTEHQRISYVSTRRWGARLVPPSYSETKAGWDNRGSYVDIVGFEIDGREARNGIKWTHGIYNGGSFSVIRNNLVHHIALDSPCTGAGGAGIGVDSYYRGIKSDVIGNTVHHIGKPGCRFVQGIYISTSGSARFNLVHHIGGAGIQMWHDANNVVVSNNTVAASTTGILVGGGDFYHTKGPNDFTTVYNNIVYDNKYGISEQGSTGLNNTYRNNLVYLSSVADWQLRNGLTHTGTIARAPQFLKYDKTGQLDFRLRGDSPAIGKGVDEQAMALEAAARQRNTRPDIGAYPFK